MGKPGNRVYKKYECYRMDEQEKAGKINTGCEAYNNLKIKNKKTALHYLPLKKFKKLSDQNFSRYAWSYMRIL